ncbi:contact-dependent growth inhibition system immunity protein [Mucilaginibacter psychrotolerans]|uniref:Uncharacterized protein n=1 Tax=Mucilaginibacter psychrotolerans TaxID=1524096 RepID=A0A4Y8SKM3_9SPHI|nr:contact-dependent growth inhibition system immunity protein [Mucilaginibacter psychrotolerans]TFF38916.1 hypothetical protein E2R66_07915 [Mucilaginibacter psychrotolerans]
MKKFENNWRYKTLENLEKNKWPDDDSDYRLVNRIAALRKIPLNDFSVEDMRLMICQNEGLDYLIPLAIGVLTNDILAEGDIYEGDLLQSVLRVNVGFWIENKDYWKTLNDLVAGNVKRIEERRIDIAVFTKINLEAQ